MPSSKRPRVQKVCAHPKCSGTWEALPSDRKIFCNRSCANGYNSTGVVRSEWVKEQISWRMKGNKNNRAWADAQRRSSSNTK